MRPINALLSTTAAAATAAILLVSCQPPGPLARSAIDPPEPDPTTVPDDVPARIVAAGDIASCNGGADATAALVAEIDGVVAALGDLAYPDGSLERFEECYAPTWGRFLTLTRPAQGNHGILTDGAAGYFSYFGEIAGAEPGGYYSYELGRWHVVVLNSNCLQAGGCEDASPQLTWLREDLARARTGNILAYWHHPRFSTGVHGDDPTVAPFWDVLYEAGADVVLNGHDHDYERSAPMAPDGTVDDAGIRQFIVGTGGRGLRPFTSERATVEYRQADELGVLRLDLEPCGYRWAFLPVGGGDALDQGSAPVACDG